MGGWNSQRGWKNHQNIIVLNSSKFNRLLLFLSKIFFYFHLLIYTKYWMDFSQNVTARGGDRTRGRVGGGGGRLGGWNKNVLIGKILKN